LLHRRHGRRNFDGVIDPLPELRRIAEEKQLLVSRDAAYGGGLASQIYTKTSCGELNWRIR